ncbi:MAG TPA: GFA family protein [Candidatus Binatia bacterium]|jgi:hypothetical protein|nr:GFA family protein [Candidatus Binatia bacterium]
MTHGSCLCGTIAWEHEGPLDPIVHCHCSRCRKAHGGAFATFAATPSDRLRIVRGQEAIGRHRSSPEYERAFCTGCGSVVPMVSDGPQSFIALGNVDEDPGTRPSGHLFAGSKAPWYAIADDQPRIDTYPDGSPGLPPLAVDDPVPGALRGSCVCGAVRFLVVGTPLMVRYCHCGRCRKARSTAHATNLFARADDLRITRGADRLRSWKLPEARFFMQVFCDGCGSPMPRVDHARDIAVVPMGALDDDPGIPVECQIFVASAAPWMTIDPAIRQFPEAP